MSDPIGYLLVIPFGLILVVFFHCAYPTQSGKSRKHRAFLAVGFLESVLLNLRDRAAALEYKNDQQLAALICLAKDNLRGAHLALVLAAHSWAAEIADNATAEIAEREISQIG